MHASLNCATQVRLDNKDRDKEKKQHDKTVVFAKLCIIRTYTPQRKLGVLL